MGWLEQLARKLLFFLESIHTSCQRRSWQSIEKLKIVPAAIADRIDDLFIDSLLRTNPRHTYSDSIGRIFCKAHANVQTQIEIQQHPHERSFAIFQNKELLYKVANSRGGVFTFYNARDEKLLRNDHDSLWDQQNRLVAMVQLAVDYPYLQSPMEIADGKGRTYMRVEQSVAKELLVFRKAITNQMVAVAALSQIGKCTNWTVTLLDPFNDKLHLLVLGALKHAQHYYFGNPDAAFGYVSGIPKYQMLVQA
jgi:hypothetical protein